MPLTTTALATNLVLQAILGEIQDFATKAEIPISTNIAAVERYNQDYWQIGAHVHFTNGWYFCYMPGGIQLMQSPNALMETVQRGQVMERKSVISHDDAIQIATKFVQRLGFSLTDLFMDIPPQIEQRNGWKKAKWLELTWWNPTMKEMPSLKVEIFEGTGELTRASFFHPKFMSRPVPRVPGYNESGEPVKETKPDKRLEEFTEDPQRRGALVDQALPEINKWIERLHLPLLETVSTNDIELVDWTPYHTYLEKTPSQKKITWGGTIRLKNKWAFEINERPFGLITGFHSPDRFFFRWDIQTRDFIGKDRSSDKENRHLISQRVSDLGFSGLEKWILKTEPGGLMYPQISRFRGAGTNGRAFWPILLLDGSPQKSTRRRK
jgi:hypothetical protein